MEYDSATGRYERGKVGKDAHTEKLQARAGDKLTFKLVFNEQTQEVDSAEL